MATASKLTIGQRLLATQGSVHILEKDSFNSHARYNYVSHDTYMEAARPLLNENGIVASFSQVSCVVGKSGMLVECELILINADDITDLIVSKAFHLQPFQGKDGLRATGKEMGASYSYCAKYLIAKALMMSSGEDIDADDDTPRNKPEPKKAAPKKAAPKKPTPKKATKKATPTPPPEREPGDDEEYEGIIPTEEWDDVREMWHAKGTISQAQGKRLWAIARNEGGWDGDDVKNEVSAGLGVDLADIPWGDAYNKIVELFQAYGPNAGENDESGDEIDPDSDIPF